LEKLRLQAEAVKKSGDLPDPNTPKAYEGCRTPEPLPQPIPQELWQGAEGKDKKYLWDGRCFMSHEGERTTFNCFGVWGIF